MGSFCLTIKNKKKMSKGFLELHLCFGNETKLFRVTHINAKSLILQDIMGEPVLVSSSVMNRLLLDNTLNCQIVKRYAKDRTYNWIAVLSIF